MHPTTMLTRRALTVMAFGLGLPLAALAAPPAGGDKTGGGDKGKPPAATPSAPPKTPAAARNPVVVISTSMGTIKAELYPDKAPVTVENFLKYVDDKHYDGTIFHRVINDFMIQGGGFDDKMTEKNTRAPIKNEAANGLKNSVGMLAMARTSVPDSATAQFYINVKDNAFLDFREPSPRGIGYAVFGKVIEGMDVVQKIKAVPTGFANGMQDVPKTPVVIKSVRRG
jgi:cyclophilin family peptidyl-prolyl cis-trans isomerase